MPKDISRKKRNIRKPLTTMSISSAKVDRIRPGTFKPLTALKFFRASRASSTCFLNDDSEGMIMMLVEGMSISAEEKRAGF